MAVEFHAPSRAVVPEAEFARRHHSPLHILSLAIERGLVVRAGDGVRWCTMLEPHIRVVPDELHPNLILFADRRIHVTRSRPGSGRRPDGTRLHGQGVCAARGV
jgi:hypothetical protein